MFLTFLLVIVDTWPVVVAGYKVPSKKQVKKERFNEISYIIGIIWNFRKIFTHKQTLTQRQQRLRHIHNQIMINLLILLPIRQHVIIQLIVGDIGLFDVFDDLLHHIGWEDG